MNKKREISEETKICINRISLYQDFSSKKENLLEEISKYDLEKKYKILKELIKEERKYVGYLTTRKNIFMKNENYEMVESERKHIKVIYKFIEWCIEYKNNLLKEEVVIEENQTQELTLDISTSDLEKIDKLNEKNNLEILTNLLNIEENRYEIVINMRKKYINLYSKEKEKLEILKEAKRLKKQLNGNDYFEKEIKQIKNNVTILNQIILFLNRIISIDTKIISKEDRKKKKQNKDISNKISKSEEKILKEISLSNDELIFNYKELLFETKNIVFIRKLLEEFPNVYTLKDGKNHFVFDTILEQYTNILLNKNYTLEENEKQKLKKEQTLKEIEYYENIILEYISFAKEKRLAFVEGSITKRVDQIISMIDTKEIYLKNGKEILLHLNYIVEALKINGLDEIENIDARQIKNEFIFSIDGNNTKAKEDAMSIKVVDGKYHLSVYITDISGFIIHNQKFVTRAQNKFLHDNEDDRIFSGQLKSMFSLNQGRSKKTVGYHLILDKNLNVLDFKIERNIINVNRNFKEAEVNKIIEDGLIQKGSDQIKLLYNLLTSKVGYEFQNPAQYIITFITRLVSRKLGEYCYLQDINCLYTVNGENKYAIHSDNALTLDNAYIKFSSPLRNYASIVNQLSILGYDKANEEIKNTHLLLHKDDKTKIKK